MSALRVVADPAMMSPSLHCESYADGQRTTPNRISAPDPTQSPHRHQKSLESGHSTSTVIQPSVMTVGTQYELKVV